MWVQVTTLVEAMNSSTGHVRESLQAENSAASGKAAFCSETLTPYSAGSFEDDSGRKVMTKVFKQSVGPWQLPVKGLRPCL